jgi:hypothetical protein
VLGRLGQRERAHISLADLLIPHASVPVRMPG